MTCMSRLTQCYNLPPCRAAGQAFLPIMASNAATPSTRANPLYRQVQIALTRKLAAGGWKPNEAIPSEQVLARSFNVSTGTIRKTVDALVAANILVRQQGKGTFVATHTEDRTLFYFYHIARKDGVKELPVHELLSFRKGRAEAEEAQRLAIGRGTPTLRMQNALKLGGRPVIFDDIVVPATLYPGLDETTTNSFSPIG